MSATAFKKRVLAEYGTHASSSRLQFQDQPYNKKIKLLTPIFKSTEEYVDPSIFSVLQETHISSNEVLLFLLSIPPKLKIKSQDVHMFWKYLFDLFNRQNESIVRAKILSIFKIFVWDSPKVTVLLINQILLLLKREKSHKVIAEGLITLKNISKNVSLSTKIIDAAKHFLSDSSHFVKRICLEIITYNNINNKDDMDLIRNYVFSEDARIRATALQCLNVFVSNSIESDDKLYTDIIALLSDDYEIARIASVNLLSTIANLSPDKLLESQNSMRMIDTAFIQISRCVSDLSLSVRKSALESLGTMSSVSFSILSETLNRKLITNLKKKESFHEKLRRYSEYVDLPSDNTEQKLCLSEIRIISGSVSGVLIQGLEDDAKEIRSVTIDTICSLSLAHKDFISLSLDFIIDMFSDEIESVRLKAIQSLTRLAQYLTLKPYQMVMVLSALGDSSTVVRSGLHQLLCSSYISSEECLKLLIECFIENIIKYPQDKGLTWNSAKQLGQRHSHLFLQLIPYFMKCHPFFDLTEPSVDEPSYVTLLIFLFNCVADQPTAMALLDEYSIKHYYYLRATLPQLIPLIFSEDDRFEIVESGKTNCDVRSLLELTGCFTFSSPETIRCQILPKLNALSVIEPRLIGPARFASIFLSNIILITKILKILNNINKFNLISIENDINSIHTTCLKLEYQFSGFEKDLFYATKKMKLLAFAIHFIFKRKRKNACPLILQHVVLKIESIIKYFHDNAIVLDVTFNDILDDLKSCSPYKIIERLKTCISCIELPKSCNHINMSFATLSLPNTSNDKPLQFTASLILSVHVSALLVNLSNLGSVRVKVLYPDGKCQYLVPPESHFYLINSDYRMETQVLLSSGRSWTDSCYVEITLCLLVEDDFVPGSKQYLNLSETQKLFVCSKRANGVLKEAI